MSCSSLEAHVATSRNGMKMEHTIITRVVSEVFVTIILTHLWRTRGLFVRCPYATLLSLARCGYWLLIDQPFDAHRMSSQTAL